MRRARTSRWTVEEEGMNRRSVVSSLACAVTLLMCSSAFALAADPESGPPPTRAQKAETDLRVQMAADWMAVRQGKLTASAFESRHAAYATQSLAADNTSLVAAGLTGNIIAMTQAPQANSYYCGPAAAYEALRYLGGSTGPGGESLTQPHLAAKCSTGYLCTNSLTETPWYVGSSYPDEAGYPMTSAMNRWTGSSWYDTTKGTTYSEAVYESLLVFDIDHTHPVVINIVEQKSTTTPHLPGHPKDRVIGHWISASGYDDYGNLTYYADSVYGASSVSWSGSVTHPFSYFSSANMYNLFATRGYVQ
jgi:hypothetical protein